MIVGEKSQRSGAESSKRVLADQRQTGALETCLTRSDSGDAGDVALYHSAFDIMPQPFVCQ